MERDPAAVVRQNAEGLKSEKAKQRIAARLLGRDAATLVSTAVISSRGDPAATAEALFRAGESVKETLTGNAARASFAATLLEKAGITESDLFPTVPKGRPIRVLYARAGAADRAFRLLSETLSDLRVGYAESNLDAAEGVESGDADLLLLPFADAAGNRVPSTESTAETHGLYLVALLRVKVGDGLIYGLYGRAILPEQNGKATLSLSFPSPDAATLAGIFAFADEARLAPEGATVRSDGGRAELSFSGERDGCLAVAVYCLAFCPGCELRGWRSAQPLVER